MSLTSHYKVCLVNPPVLGIFEPWYDKPDFGRVGLAYLAGYLRQYPGYEIKIIDAKFDQLNFEQVRRQVRDFEPDLVGFTAFTNEIKPAAYQAGLIKRDSPGTVTVIGGVHVTSLPRQSMEEFPTFDIAAIGEGEVTFSELCGALKYGAPLEDVKGIVFRKGGEIVQNPPRERILDQDSIPFPAWDLLPAAETYFIQSLRGCPFNCKFCMNPNGRVARKRSVQNVIDELNWIIDTYQPSGISFGDELFSVDMERTRELVDAMVENGIGEKVTWDVQTHVRFVDYDLFVRMNKAKVERVELGIETGDEEMLKKMGKGTSLDTIMKAHEEAEKANAPIGTFFLFGQPNETPDTLKRTIDLAVKINPQLPMFGLMTPYPGTEVARLAAKEEGGYRLLTTDWDEYNKQIGGAMDFANLSRTQIEWFQTLAYLKVFLKNHRYLAFFQFLWTYKEAAVSVLKKMIFKQESLSEQIQKPADYDEVINSNIQVDIESLVTARDEWQKTQKDELKRAKRYKPEAVKVHSVT
jgi:radical SAM superfamily enzyme YgiQ (UPF0313 family)